MKLHDLKPAPGSRKARTRVGRGIAGGKGKTAGRGTKGQKSRAGGKIAAWFEGGQTPMHIRLPKLHGFKQRGRIDYQVVNVGRISEYAVAGRFGAEAGNAPLTINSEVLLGAGLISTERRPVKVLGNGDVEAKLFVAADAFTKSARAKIEAAGGFVQSLAPERAPAPEDEPAPPSTDTAEATEAAADPTSATADAGSSKAPRAQKAEPDARPGPDAAAEPESLELGAAGDAHGDADAAEATPTEGKATGTASSRSKASAKVVTGPESATPATKAAAKPATKAAAKTAAKPATKAATKAAAKTAPKRAAKPTASASAAAIDAAADDATSAAASDTPAEADADAPPARRGRTRKSADSADA